MRRFSALLVLGLAMLVPAVPACAEWFGDVYLGGAFTSSDDLSVRDTGIRQPIDSHGSVTVGGRVGHWFEALPWLGVAVDGSYFTAAPGIVLFPITALVMARYGLLPDDDFPRGRLQPYAGLGGGMFISNADGRIGNVPLTNTSTDAGLDLRLGVSYGLQENIKAFAEYRFTHVSPSFDVQNSSPATTASTKFNTSHFVVGLGFRF